MVAPGRNCSVAEDRHDSMAGVEVQSRAVRDAAQVAFHVTDDGNAGVPMVHARRGAVIDVRSASAPGVRAKPASEGRPMARMAGGTRVMEG